MDCSTTVSLDQMLADADQLLTDFSLDYKQMAKRGPHRRNESELRLHSGSLFLLSLEHPFYSLTSPRFVW